MNIKLHSSELNRIMKTIIQCIDSKFERFSNIEIVNEGNFLTIRGTDGSFQASVSTPLLGGDGEKFCVDGTFFAKACAMCGGDVQITTDERTCTIKGAGRTRLPIVDAEIPEFKPLPEKTPTTFVKAEDFMYAFSCVSHAISTDQSRIQLTGVLTEVDETGLRMTTLDGFRMSIETVDCDGDPMKVIIPGSFMKLIQNSTIPGEVITLKTDGKRIEAVTDSIRISCGLLIGDFPDVKRITPESFKTECLINVNQIRDALRGSCALNSKNNLVKITIDESKMTIMSNSEQADYDAEINCQTNGNALTIAFNQKYLAETIASVNSEDAVMRFNTMASPCVVTGKTGNGFRLILPVRVAG